MAAPGEWKLRFRGDRTRASLRLFPATLPQEGKGFVLKHTLSAPPARLLPRLAQQACCDPLRDRDEPDR